MAQSVVEFLIGFMSKNQYFIGNDLVQGFKQATQIEKEQRESLYTKEELLKAMEFARTFSSAMKDEDFIQSLKQK